MSSKNLAVQKLKKKYLGLFSGKAETLLLQAQATSCMHKVPINRRTLPPVSLAPLAAVPPPPRPAPWGGDPSLGRKAKSCREPVT